MSSSEQVAERLQKLERDGFSISAFDIDGLKEALYRVSIQRMCISLSVCVCVVWGFVVFLLSLSVFLSLSFVSRRLFASSSLLLFRYKERENLLCRLYTLGIQRTEKERERDDLVARGFLVIDSGTARDH